MSRFILLHFIAEFITTLSLFFGILIASRGSIQKWGYILHISLYPQNHTLIHKYLAKVYPGEISMVSTFTFRESFYLLYSFQLFILYIVSLITLRCVYCWCIGVLDSAFDLTHWTALRITEKENWIEIRYSVKFSMLYHPAPPNFNLIARINSFPPQLSWWGFFP